MGELVVIDDVPKRGPFYVWRRESDGYVGVSLRPMDGERYTPLLRTEDWEQARAYVIVERYGWEIDLEGTYDARWTRVPMGGGPPLSESRTQVPGGELAAKLRELFASGPYDGGARNVHGNISLAGVERLKDGDVVAMVLFMAPKKG